MQTFDIGRTFARAWQIATASLVSVGAFLLAVQVVSAALQWGMRSMMPIPIAEPGSRPDPAAAFAMFGSGSYWALVLITMLLGAFASAGALHGMLRTADGRPTTLGDCVGVGVVTMIPMLGLIILWSLGITLGMILLVVPGLILITMWSCAMQALVAENLGVIASFGRSRELTKGSRLLIFVTLLAFIVMFYVVILGLIGAVFGVRLVGFAAAMNASPLIALIMVPVGWLSGMALNALLVSIYAECVTIKGGTTGQVTEVFS